MIKGGVCAGLGCKRGSHTRTHTDPPPFHLKHNTTNNRRVATVFSCPETPAQTRLFTVDAGSDHPDHEGEVHELVALKPLAELHDAMDRRVSGSVLGCGVGWA